VWSCTKVAAAVVEPYKAVLCGHSFARGHYTTGKEIVDLAPDRILKLAAIAGRKADLQSS
jgi:hypothetical protein